MAHNYEIQVTEVEAKTLAVVKDVAYSGNIGPKIGAALPVVFAKLKELGQSDLGQPVVVYFPNQGERWDVAPGIPIEVGVQLAAALPAESTPLAPSFTPACRVATTVHAGPYQGLPDAHMDSPPRAASPRPSMPVRTKACPTRTWPSTPGAAKTATPWPAATGKYTANTTTTRASSARKSATSSSSPSPRVVRQSLTVVTKGR
jgi:hypothetical protein